MNMKKSGKDTLVGQPPDDSMTAEQQEAAIREAGGSPEQTELAEQPAQPNAVQNGRIMVRFNSSRFYVVKDDRRVDLEIAYPLTPDHAAEGILPREVTRYWDFMQASKAESCKKMVDIPCGDLVTVRFYSNPTSAKALLEMEGVEITKATLAHVVETGRGKEVEYIRFSFSLTLTRDRNVCKFATESDDEEFWAEIFTPQGDLVK